MFEVLSHFFGQSFFLGRPALTEQNLADQSGKVVIITGGYAGVGKELVRILYEKDATIYIAGRSYEKADQAIKDIKQSVKNSNGKLEFLKIDLSDLHSIKPAAEEFLKRETRLDVLVNNAGVMFPPIGTKSAQGHEIQISTNCLGPFLFTQLLTPILETTAASAPKATLRVLWAGSLGVDAISPSQGGMMLDKAGNFQPHESNNQTNYGMSKVGNYFFAAEYARRHPVSADGKGVLSIAFNPGNLKTELQRHSAKSLSMALVEWMLYPAVYGAYTELWAGWSPSIESKNNGAYVWPWGKLGGVRPDVKAELRKGGKAEKFWDWCERETQPFA